MFGRAQKTPSSFTANSLLATTVRLRVWGFPDADVEYHTCPSDAETIKHLLVQCEGGRVYSGARSMVCERRTTGLQSLTLLQIVRGRRNGRRTKPTPNPGCNRKHHRGPEGREGDRRAGPLRPHEREERRPDKSPTIRDRVLNPGMEGRSRPGNEARLPTLPQARHKRPLHALLRTKEFSFIRDDGSSQSHPVETQQACTMVRLVIRQCCPVPHAAGSVRSSLLPPFGAGVQHFFSVRILSRTFFLSSTESRGGPFKAFRPPNETSNALAEAWMAPFGKMETGPCQ